MAQMDLVSGKKVSILCFGDKIDCENVFKKIVNYDSSINKIYINEIDKNLYSFGLNTKYYDLELTLELISLESYSDRVSSIASDEHFLNNIQSIFVVLSDKSCQFLSQIDRLVSKIQKLNKSNSCLNILVLNWQTERPEILSKQFENFLKIKLNEDKNLLDEEEEFFSDLDELVNSILVHSWEGIELKSDKLAKKKFENVNSELDSEQLDDKNFNLENLMMNLKDIREKSLNMDFEDRKKFAENVTLNFWKSVGGDPDEINGLDEE